MKKLFGVLLCALCLAVFAGAFGVSAADNADFVPVLRFVASSDTHVRTDDDRTAVRIGKMMDEAYAIAAKDKHYKKVDALLVCGDLTDDGTKAQFEKFDAAVDGALRNGTRFLGVVAQAHDGMGMLRTKMLDTYSALAENTPDFHAVIGGFHFIGLSVSRDLLEHYDPGQLLWLKKQLDAAVRDDPNKPVFVMHHEHNLNTVYGSSAYDRWCVPHFNAILKKYPQVVDFSGHSHYPLNDPRSIWQKEYTAIGTGGLYYAEFTVDGLRKVRPSDAYDTAACWLVEVSAQGDLRLRGLDIEKNSFLCEYVLKNPTDPANREYTPEKRKAASSAPVFTADSKLETVPEYGVCTVRIPAARSTDGMPVVLYRARAVDRFGMTAAREWVLPSYYRAVPQNAVTLDLQPLAQGTYTVTVVAETAYGVQSEPLETVVTVEGRDAFLTFFSRMFSELKKGLNFLIKIF